MASVKDTVPAVPQKTAVLLLALTHAWSVVPVPGHQFKRGVADVELFQFPVPPKFVPDKVLLLAPLASLSQ